MKLRPVFVCNSSSSDFVATSKAHICYGKGDEKMPDMVTIPFNDDLEKIKEGQIITLENTKEGWSKDFKLIKIYCDVEAEGLPVFFFFQELDGNGIPYVTPTF